MGNFQITSYDWSICMLWYKIMVYDWLEARVTQEG